MRPVVIHCTYSYAQRGRLLAFDVMVCALFIVLVQPLRAQVLTQTPPADAAFAFDVGRQPLREAIKSISADSGWQIIYDAAVVRGKTGAPAKGVMSPQAAMNDVLANSSLMAAAIAPGTLSIVRRPELRSPPAYFGALQQGVMRALCAHPLTRPENYRAVLRYVGGPASGTGRMVITGSSGSSNRDAAIIAALSSIEVAVPPPPMTPIKIIIEPSRPGAMTCPD
jgi:hypothetical protein